MRWASAISERGDEVDGAVNDVIARLRGELEAIDLAVVFASPAIADAVAARLEAVGAKAIVGCTGAGIIGDAREIEDRPALSITAARLPGVELAPFHVDAGAETTFPIGLADPQGVLLLADPFTCDVHELIGSLDERLPRVPKFGGLASGARAPGSTWLHANGESHARGAVGVAFGGDVAIDTLVAQGCRPIGTPMVVTRADGSIIRELDHRPPLEIIKALHDELGPRDRALLRQSLFVGVEMQDSVVHRSGELLVRNIAGIDPKSGALAVAAELRPFQVVQFLLRDADTATDDLTRLLERHRASGSPVDGALLFSCLGRGARLFGEPDHDSALFQRLVGPAPIGGFFCNGEIGPVGGTTFLHGYTSSFALFRRRRRD
jgi:small ligand-binding sensory domain FIST